MEINNKLDTMPENIKLFKRIANMEENEPICKPRYLYNILNNS